MTRIRTLALAAAFSAIACSGAQAGGSTTGTGGINGTSLMSLNGWGNGMSLNGLDSSNGLGSENGLGTYNALTGNGMSLNGVKSNGMSLNGVSGSNGVDASAKAGHTILEIRLADGTVARTGR